MSERLDAADRALLLGMIFYTLLLTFATADDILGWGLFAGLLR